MDEELKKENIKSIIDFSGKYFYIIYNNKNHSLLIGI